MVRERRRGRGRLRRGRASPRSDPVDVAAVLAGKHGVVAVRGRTGHRRRRDARRLGARLVDLAAAAEPARRPASRRPTTRRSRAARWSSRCREPIAATVGWPEKKLTWTDLLSRSPRAPRCGPASSSRPATRPACPACSSLARAAGHRRRRAGPAGARPRRCARWPPAGPRYAQDLLARFPRSTDPASIASGTQRRAALRGRRDRSTTRSKPPVPLAALYLEPAPMSLDYPYAVMPGIEPAQGRRGRGPVQGARPATASGTSSAQAAPARAATAPGATASGLRRARPARPARPPPTSIADRGGTAAGGPDPAAVDRALSTWTAVTLPGRMLAVIDVSGSMLEKVPTANNATRMQVTLAAAQRASRSSTTRGRSASGSSPPSWSAPRTTGNWCRSAR